MFNISIIIIIIFALTFDFINGFHDTANAIATSVSTRVLSPKNAILMAAILNMLGALMSSKVAKTIASGIVDNSIVSEHIVIITLCTAIIWNLITWYFAMPSSSSHALIGSLIGAAIASAGSLQIVKWGPVLLKVVTPLFTSPILGFVFGYLLMKILSKTLHSCSSEVISKYFSKLQIVSAAFMAYSHGNNDAQKSMGIITLALISVNLNNGSNNVQLWVIILCALAMAAGTFFGGWKIIKTMGSKMIKLQPINGFAAETSAATAIQIMTCFGAPVSTTHVISSAIMGVGASKRLKCVRWTIIKNIVFTWIITIPITATFGALITATYKLFIR